MAEGQDENNFLQCKTEAEGHSPATWSHPESSEHVTADRKSGIKMRDHEMSKYRESTFPFKDVLPRSHSPFKLIYLRNDAECKHRNFFTVNFLTVLRQKFTKSKDVSHTTYTLHQVCFVASSLAII